MNESALTPPGTLLAGKPLIRTRRLSLDLHRWLGLILSAAILVAIAVQLGRGGLVALVEARPRTAGFWLVFALLYVTPSLSEWLIFHRLWRLPGAGLIALMRKQIANELVLGYSGDAHFYLWARRHLAMTNSPFGAVKDVAILSAVAGNAATLLLMAVSWPVLAEAVSGPLARAFAGSVVVIATSSLTLLVLRRQLFSLSRNQLAMVFIIHSARIVTCLGLLAMLAHLLLPAVSTQWLLVIVTLRMMVSRLPLIPAQDVAFAGLVALLFGRAADIVPVIALVASLTVATHIVIGFLSCATMIGRPTDGIAR